MTKLKEYLIRKSSGYVEPKSTLKKIYIASIIFIVISIVSRVLVIWALCMIALIGLVVSMILIDLKDTLMKTIQNKQNLFANNNLIWVLLSEEKFVCEYIFFLVIIPISGYSLIRFKPNLIFWVISVFLLFVVDSIISMFISKYFEKLLH